jgi:hypothetical protein
MEIKPKINGKTGQLFQYFTLGTANSATFKCISVQISGIRANPLKYTDPDGKSDYDGILDTKSASIANISAESNQGSFNASGEANAGYAEFMIRGQGISNESSKGTIGLFGKVSGGNAAGKIGIGNEDVSVSLKGVGDVATATAQAGIQFNSNGMALNLEAKAATVSGRATLEFDVFGVRVELGVTGNALSIGAGVSLGVTGNKGFYAKASAALGVGGEVLLRIQKKP